MEGALYLVTVKKDTHILLLEKIYGSRISQSNALRSAQDIIEREIGSLQLKQLETTRGNGGYLSVSIVGADSQGTKNYLKWKFGAVINFDELEVGSIRRGHLVSPERVGFGIFIDIGVLNPKKDALLPLYTLRKQLVNRKTFSLKQIVQNYGFLENFPVDVDIVAIDRDKETITVALTKSTLERFEIWRKDRLERVICCGASRREIRRALSNAGAMDDIRMIERLGLMEHAIVCLFGINASLLIRRVGPYLPAVSMSVFRPQKIRKMVSSRS
jgi:hypothetical protein